MDKILVEKTKKYVSEIYQSKYDVKFAFHSFDHVCEVAEAAEKIGRGSNLPNEDLEAVIIAAWFHDTGYLFQRENHELQSAKVAEEFLRANNYPETKIKKVTECILATQANFKPANLSEEVIRDADYVGLGSADNFKKSKLLRAEMLNLDAKELSDEEWLSQELEFLKSHSYHTSYARIAFDEQKSDNIKKLKKKIKKEKEQNALSPEIIALMEKEKRKSEELRLKMEMDEKKESEKRENISIKGFESIFRLTSSNHMRLNAIADRKANLMLTLSGIMISISMSMLAPKLDTHPQLIIPTGILILVSLLTIVFATLSTRPKITAGKVSKEDIENKKANLLFFGNFANMNFDDFDWGIRKMMRETDYLHGSMIQDFYSLGKVLNKKFRYLHICYNVFMYGIIISVLAFAITIAFIPAQP